MQFNTSTLDTVEAKLKAYYELDVEVGNTLFTVYADSPKAINEFESRLVAEQMKVDGEFIDDEVGNVAILLDELVNLVDARGRFEPQVDGNSKGTWVASYYNQTLILG